MPDVVSTEVRSRMMSGIQGVNTKPELFLRKGLFARGFRYRLHDKRLPGRPDMVLKGCNAVIFAHGCFWHGHGCAIFKWPSTRAKWWRDKIERNRANDKRAERFLGEVGWRVGVVWECALKGPQRLAPEDVLDTCERWLRSKIPRVDIQGRK